MLNQYSLPLFFGAGCPASNDPQCFFYGQI
jgi:hypothetical protein